MRLTRAGRRYLRYAFTEHGAIMAAMILNTPRAIEVSVYVVPSSTPSASSWRGPIPRSFVTPKPES